MKVEEVAVKYIGQKEKPGNMGFLDEWFENRMRAVGFKPAQAWCAYFAELCFREAMPERSAELDKLFSASTIQTFRNFRDAGHLISNVPVSGSLVIWQTVKEGKPMTTGHAGIVVAVLNPTTFTTVEGNTSGEGVREGWIVARRQRQVIQDVKDGLKILGFIHV